MRKKVYLHKSGHNVRGGPTNDEAGFHRLAAFRHVFYVTGRKPELTHLHDLLQFKVPAATSFRDQQKIGEEEEMPLLGLHALKSRFYIFDISVKHFLVLSKILSFIKIDKYVGNIFSS